MQSKCRQQNKAKQTNNKRNKRTTHTKSIPVRHMRIEIQMRIQIQIQFRFKSVKGNTDKRQAAGGKRDMLTVPAAQHNIQHTTHSTQQKLARASTMFGQPLTSSLFFGHIIKIDCRIVAPSCGRPVSVRPVVECSRLPFRL